MLPRRLAAQAVVLASVMASTAAFLLHMPCRSSGYIGNRFTSFCYSDIPPLLAREPLLSGGWPFGGLQPVDQAPVPALIAWLISKIPLAYTDRVVFFNLVLAGFAMWLAITVLKQRYWRPLDAALVALLPLWPFVIFISTDVIAVALSAAALFAWHRNDRTLAGIYAGIALASGSWTVIIVVAILVEAYRLEAIRNGLQVAAIAGVIALVANLPRLMAGQSFLNPWDNTAGEGSIGYVVSLMLRRSVGDSTLQFAIAMAIMFVIVRWAARIQHDFRVELLVTALVSVQLLFSPTIPPQNIVRLAWLIPFALPRLSSALRFATPLIVYVATVWLHFESTTDGGKGANDQTYGIVSIVMWVTLAALAAVCIQVMARPGRDRVAVSYAEYVHDTEPQHDWGIARA